MMELAKLFSVCHVMPTREALSARSMLQIETLAAGMHIQIQTHRHTCPYIVTCQVLAFQVQHQLSKSILSTSPAYVQTVKVHTFIMADISMMVILLDCHSNPPPLLPLPNPSPAYRLEESK